MILSTKILQPRKDHFFLNSGILGYSDSCGLVTAFPGCYNKSYGHYLQFTPFYYHKGFQKDFSSNVKVRQIAQFCKP